MQLVTGNTGRTVGQSTWLTWLTWLTNDHQRIEWSTGDDHIVARTSRQNPDKFKPNQPFPTMCANELFVSFNLWKARQKPVLGNLPPEEVLKLCEPFIALGGKMWAVSRFGQAGRGKIRVLKPTELSSQWTWKRPDAVGNTENAPERGVESS